tara:strand:- start:86 stop:562 length:477 start_codon:yes stop_codon:yes gene_type:complete
MSPFQYLVLGFSSSGGLGYVPKAPGTFGTLGAIPLWFFASRLGLSWVEMLGAVAVFTVFAIGVAEQAERIYQEHDSGKIVIDEVAGFLVTLIGVPFEWSLCLSAFVVFRFFDIVKPPPVRQIDARLGGGAGVVLDDTMAGLYGLGVMHLLCWLNGGWW